MSQKDTSIKKKKTTKKNLPKNKDICSFLKGSSLSLWLSNDTVITENS